MARTTPIDVEKLLGPNYDCVNNPSLKPYISGANKITTRVAACATQKGYTLSSSELQDIEMWIAAHLYTITDPLYVSKSTLSASGSFKDRSYLDGAMAIDLSGCVKAIMEGARADLDWVGKTVDEQIDWEDRN